MILFGSTFEAADDLGSLESLFKESVLETLLELHDLHIVLISDSGYILKMGVFQNGMSLSEEVIDDENATLVSPGKIKDFLAVLLDQWEDLGWYGLITHIDLVIPLSIILNSGASELLPSQQRALRLRNEFGLVLSQVQKSRSVGAHCNSLVLL